VFDRYMIVDDSLRPTSDGFEVDVRITYYRSLALSMIAGFDVTIDGEPTARDGVRFVLRGVGYSLEEMADEADVRWGFGEIATLAIRLPEGLAEGPHTIGVVQELRIFYMPGGILRGQDTKSLRAGF
jgi:hypothetical protein